MRNGWEEMQQGRTEDSAWKLLHEATLGVEVEQPKIPVRGRLGDVEQSLISRAIRARRAWWVAGGTRRAEWLRRWDVHDGLYADKCERWKVRRIIQVQRPEHRKGQQLEVQVEWEGMDTITKTAWGIEWIKVGWLTDDLKVVAREKEKEAYPVAAPVRGWRRSPRLAENEEAEKENTNESNGDQEMEREESEEEEGDQEEVERTCRVARAIAAEAAAKEGIKVTTWEGMTNHRKLKAKQVMEAVELARANRTRQRADKRRTAEEAETADAGGGEGTGGQKRGRARGERTEGR